MRSNDLTYRSLRHYRRFWLLVAAASAVAAAVIAGSLAVGDSVRHSLRQRALDRLGQTQSIISAGSGYLDADFVHAFPGAAGVLYSDGFVSAGGRLIPVTVWGMDDIAEGTAAVNGELSREAGLALEEGFALRLPRNSLVPSGSLFVTEAYATAMRLRLVEIRPASQGGNLGLRNVQTLPLNVFVSRRQLCELLETGDKVNLILSPSEVDAVAVEAAFRPELAGLSVRKAADGRFEVVSEHLFLPDLLSDRLREADPVSDRLYSYLANTLASRGKSIPYSFVTAVDSYRGRVLDPDEILLSDYAARRLGARVGDSVQVSYYVSPEMKRLDTEAVSLRVGGIVPLQEILSDPGLSADYPGLSDATRCTDWDSDLPIDMSRITDEDERYWELYRAAPKAILPYAAVAGDWRTPFGSATALRLAEEPDWSALSAADFGISVLHPRQGSLAAAEGGVDFGGLFLALGCFILFAALLLVASPVSEMLAKRRPETELLSSVGYSARRIHRLRLREAVPVIIPASLAGVLAGILYAALVLFLLGNLWRGATHTGGFTLFLRPLTLLLSLAAGIVLSFAVLSRVLRRGEAAGRVRREPRTSTGWITALLCTLALPVLPLCRHGLGTVVAFVLEGCFALAALTLWLRFILIRRRGLEASRKGLVDADRHAARRRQMLSFITLSLGVFIVFAVGLNRQDFAVGARELSGTGGYDYWGETTVPVYYDMNSRAGRTQLSLGGLSPDAHFLQFLLADGDDASCLNLNKVETPAVLGADLDALLDAFPATGDTDLSHGGVLVDATALEWSLMKRVGDTLHFAGTRSGSVDWPITGTLQNSLFQGYAVTSREAFADAWPETTGSRVFLLRSDDPADAGILAAALNDYGLRLVPTNERLRQFHSVTDTYLTIFFMLGAIGLLLSLLSFYILVRKDIHARQDDIRLLQVLGYSQPAAAELLTRTYLPVPLAAVPAGAAAAFISVLASLGGISVAIWLSFAILILLFLWLIRRYVQRAVREGIRQSYEPL